MGVERGEGEEGREREIGVREEKKMIGGSERDSNDWKKGETNKQTSLPHLARVRRGVVPARCGNDDWSHCSS